MKTFDSNKVKIYVADDGTEWTKEEIKNYLKYNVSSDNITEEDVEEFFRYCKSQKLNPYDIHLQKYGDGKPVVVISKYAFLKRAEKSGKFAGYRAGVVVERNGKLIYREGSIVLKGETLVGGWAEAYRKDWKVPAKVEVGLEEYMRRDRNGKPFPMWKEKPATMIRKVALVHALREAFPNEVGKLEVVSDDVDGDNGGVEVDSYEEIQEEGQEKEEEKKENGEGEQKEEQKQVGKKELKRIWALATEVFGGEGKKKEDVRNSLHQLMESEFGKNSSKELTPEEASKLIEMLETAKKKIDEWEKIRNPEF
jgi:phage recombination protein Bet